MTLSTVHHQRTSIAAALAALALSACVVAPLPQRGVVYNTSPNPYPANAYPANAYPNYPTYPVYAQPAPVQQPVYVVVAPPPQQVEVVPVAPFLGAVWISGFWGWNGGRHQWTQGHYTRPVQGHRFVPHRWENHGGRWAQHGGHWAR
jgi:hypothetical protein